MDRGGVGPQPYIHPLTRTIFGSMKAYTVVLDKKPITVIDPEELPVFDLLNQLIRKFGTSRISKIVNYGEYLECQTSTPSEKPTTPKPTFSELL